MTKVKKRRLEILKRLDTEGLITLQETATLFGVTKETIRKDFDQIAYEYGIKRVHGGLKKDKENTYKQHYHYQVKKQIHIEEKQRICHKVIDNFHPNDCIYIDSGSTVSFILNYMNRLSDITIVTPSLALLTKYLMEGYETIFKQHGHTFIFIGGHINTTMLTCFGSYFDHAIENFNFDKMIISADALDMEGGITNSDEVAYDIVRKVSKRSRHKYLLADHSKFGFIASYRTLPWDKLDYVVSSYTLPLDWVTFFEQEEIEYIQA